MTTAAGSGLRAAITPLTDVAALADDWLSVEGQAAASCFRSWAWMGPFCELASRVAGAPGVLRVMDGSAIVAIALLWPGRERRHGFVGSRTLHLNTSGQPALDSVTLEHNGLLAVRGREQEATAAAIEALASEPSWDELFIPGILDTESAAWSDAAARHGLRWVSRWQLSDHFIDLEGLRVRGQPYVDSLSTNTRYQVRRAMKAYAARGELRLGHPAQVEEALAWLDELAKLHQAQWTAKGHAGAFGSEFARAFHRCVVLRGWSRGAVQVVRACAGDTVLGYLYNFSHGGVVSNYQSGHVVEAHAKLKPGLVTHCLAVEDALRRGAVGYDLLVGGDHFKPSLSDVARPMAWSVLQRRHLRFALEHRLRAWRDRWRARAAERATPVNEAESDRD